MNKYETIRKYCKINGISVAKLERDLDFARGSIAKIDEHKPSMNKIWKICEYLRMPIQELMDISEEQSKLMEDFNELIHKPLYRTAAGQGAYNDTHADEIIEEADDGYEYATVIGDSMLPLLQNGDIVKIEPTTETSPHDLTVVKVNGDEATIKYCEIVENGIWLRAENKSVFEDKFYTIQDVVNMPISVIGKVVEMRRKIK